MQKIKANGVTKVPGKLIRKLEGKLINQCGFKRKTL